MFRITTQQVVEAKPNVENYGNASPSSSASQKSSSTLTSIYCDALSESNEL